jgi:cysteine desulfurase/selenocysteine lyase
MSNLERNGLSNLPLVLRGVTTVTLADGNEHRIVQLNNAATTPPLAETVEVVSAFLEHYGALHRGQGPRARQTCQAVEQAIAAIRNFLRAGPDCALLFTENSSSAINLFARLFDFTPEGAVLTSEIEHTSNYLPWTMAGGARIVEARATFDGGLDYDDLEAKARSTVNLRVVAITGASNQSGFVPDLRRVSEIAHANGALCFVDAAQLAPHRPIDMAADGIDALVFSAHKLYAPFGVGVLALPRKLLDRVPINPGGGSIDMITKDDIIWAAPSERHQTGTWNATGIVGLGASCQAINRLGWSTLITQEHMLTERMIDRLKRVSGLRLMVPPEKYRNEDRVGVFPFTLEGYHHALLAAILENEYAIEVRAGTICNHRLVRRWFEVGDQEQADIERRILAGDRLASYGVVRASLGIQNTVEDVDALGNALESIVANGPQLRYFPEPVEETFRPHVACLD